MAVYLVSYDLHERENRYREVHAKLESLGDFCHCLQSVYLIESEISLKDFRDRCAGAFAEGFDSYIVTDCHEIALGFPIDEATDAWLKKKRGFN